MTVRKLVFQNLKKNGFFVFLFSAAIFFLATCLSGIGVFFYFLIDQGLPDYSSLHYLGFFGCVLTLLFFSIFFQNYGLCRFITQFVANLRKEIFEKTVQQDLVFFDKNPLKPQIFLDMQKFQDNLERILPLFFKHLLIIVLSSASIIWLSSLFIFLALLLLPGIFLQHLYILGQNQTNYLIQHRSLRELNKFVSDTFSKIKTIQLFDQQSETTKKFEKKVNDFTLLNRVLTFRFSFSIACYVLLFLSLLTGIIFIGADFIQKEYITVGALTAFIYLFFLIFSSLYILSQNIFPISEIFGFIKNLNAMLALKTENNLSKKKLKSYPAKGFITFHNVSFSYPKTPEQIVLHDINFSIYPGQIVVIFGPIGAGKTTLLNLILRFYKPNKGSIYFDGVDLNDLSLNDIRIQIAAVEQDPTLFSGTIYENTCFGNPYINEEEVIKLFDILMPDNWYNQFPKGIHTVIGERGRGLSMGQKQCIALIRALARNPSVLLLDEAMSGLDTLSEQHVNKGLKPILRERTTIIVTHRTSHIALADRILLMRSGRIIAFGEHDELWAENLSYRRFVQQETAFQKF